MSKITNDGLTRSDTDALYLYPSYGSSGRQRVNIKFTDVRSRSPSSPAMILRHKPSVQFHRPSLPAVAHTKSRITRHN